MAEENITLISEKYAESNLIERGEYTELENKVNGNTTSITDLGNTVNTVKGDVDDILKPKVTTLEQSVESNKQAITTLEQDVAKKQDQLTSDNAGDNITITGEGSTLKINAAGGGGETKAKAWLCSRNGNSEAGCDYSYLEQYVGTILESVNCADASQYWPNDEVFWHQIAKVVFKEEKSMAEVSQWLNFEAEINMGSTLCSDLQAMAGYGFCAVCPWPDNVPWPESN